MSRVPSPRRLSVSFPGIIFADSIPAIETNSVHNGSPPVMHKTLQVGSADGGGDVEAEGAGNLLQKTNIQSITNI